MFHKFCVFVILAGFSGVAFADAIPEVVTSEVFEDSVKKETVVQEQRPVQEYRVVKDTKFEPVWPVAGSEADVEIVCEGTECGDDFDVVTSVGSGLVIENNIQTVGDGWSGGPNIVNGTMIPAGFDYECANNAEMPLLRREMMEDDGGSVLAMSRSPRKSCKTQSDAYAVFAERAGFATDETSNVTKTYDDFDTSKSEIVVDERVEVKEDSANVGKDTVQSWVVVSGQTLREVLQDWCDKSGWDLVWTTDREYPIEASAVFKGRFADVASALVRNFERATPIPYAKFYKGNRVIVVSTTEE